MQGKNLFESKLLNNFYDDVKQEQWQGCLDCKQLREAAL